MADLAQCTVGAEQPAAAISTFATALLFLNLAVLTDVRTSFSLMLWLVLTLAFDRRELTSSSAKCFM